MTTGAGVDKEIGVVVSTGDWEFGEVGIELEGGGWSMHVLQVIWSWYESTDVSTVNPMRFTVVVFHLNYQNRSFW